MARITNALRHTHKYFRMPTTGLWYCAGIDGCTHYMPKNMPEPVGRMSICWHCEKEFKLVPVNMMENKPICDKCVEAREIMNVWVEENEGAVVEKNPYASLGANNPLEALKRRAQQRQEEEAKRQSAPPQEDQVEVIPENETHAADCEVYTGGSCTCS